MWLICSFMVRESGTMLDGGADQVLLGHLAVLEPRLGDRRDDALLDLGAGPADGERDQLLDVEARRIVRRGGSR